MNRVSFLPQLTKSDYFQGFKSYFIERAKSNKRLLPSAPIEKSLSLSWCLNNWEYLSCQIEKEIKYKTYAPSIRQQAIVYADKERKILSASWIDKIVECGITKLLSNAYEPLAPSSLHSHRKGHSSHKIIKELAKFIKKSGQKNEAVYIFKCDIKSYTDSLIPSLALKKIEDLFGTQDPYFIKIISSLMQPSYRAIKSGEIQTLNDGVPTGAHLTNFLANIYLHDLDCKLSSLLPFYCRFGDDLLLISYNYNDYTEAKVMLYQYFSSHNLTVNHKKSSDIVFKFQDRSSLNNDNYFIHLGFRIGKTGAIHLTPKKYRILKDNLKLLLKRQALIFKKEKIAADLVLSNLINTTKIIYSNFSLVRHLSDLISVCNDEDYLKKFDLWLVKQILSLSYDLNPDTSLRKIPVKKLRDLGLDSVRHIKVKRFKKCH